MDMVKISCPYCGLSKTVPRDKAPTKPVKANCPKCKHQFPIHPDKLQPVEPIPAGQPGAPQQTPGYQAPPQPAPKAPEEIDPHSGLGGSPETIGNLFNQSFGIFASRFLPIVGLYLLMFIMILVPTGILGAGTVFLIPMMPDLSWLIILVGSLLTTIVFTYFLFWGYGAFVHAVIDQTCGFGEALKRGREQTWSFFWALSLAAFLITGGYFLFFIPGIIFGVWFLFVPFIIALENERGMDALLKSYQYVRGNWWNTFFKLFILILVCGAVGVIPFVGWVLSLLTTPFMLIFMFTMYYDLQQIKGTHPVRATTGRKAKWIVAGSLGYIVIPVVIIVMAGGAFFSTLMMGLENSGMPFNLPTEESYQYPQQQQQQQTRVQQPARSSAPPPQKVLTSTATVNVTKNRVKPGATLFINFNNIAEPAPKDWIGLYRVEDPNEQYGEWTYLDSKANGTLTFLAPGQPGVYEARLFLDWPSGGYHDVARTQKIYVENSAPIQETPPTVQQPSSSGSPLDKFRKNKQSPAPQPQQAAPTGGNADKRFSATVPDPKQLYIYVYALNYKGDVSVNGQPFYKIEGEENTSYNFTGGGSNLRYGENTIDISYDAIPGNPWKTSAEIKIYSIDFGSGQETVIGNWSTEVANGKTLLVLDLKP